MANRQEEFLEKLEMQIRLGGLTEPRLKKLWKEGSSIFLATTTMSRLLTVSQAKINVEKINDDLRVVSNGFKITGTYKVLLFSLLVSYAIIMALICDFLGLFAILGTTAWTIILAFEGLLVLALAVKYIVTLKQNNFYNNILKASIEETVNLFK